MTFSGLAAPAAVEVAAQLWGAPAASSWLCQLAETFEIGRLKIIGTAGFMYFFLFFFFAAAETKSDRFLGVESCPII